jgi:hypothetical protein
VGIRIDRVGGMQAPIWARQAVAHPITVEKMVLLAFVRVRVRVAAGSV